MPAFPGLHAVRQAIEKGVKLAGCTVHFVDAGTDTGLIIAQAAVPVFPDDSEATLGSRILVQEHLLYPFALRLAVQGKVGFEAGSVQIASSLASPEGVLRNPAIR